MIMTGAKSYSFGTECVESFEETIQYFLKSDVAKMMPPLESITLQ